jgi:hypothetical protein
LTQPKADKLYKGTNYIGGTGETQSDAAWLVPLCLQLFPAIILFVGMLFMVRTLHPRSASIHLHMSSPSRPDGSSITTAKPKPARHSPACVTCRKTTIWSSSSSWKSRHNLCSRSARRLSTSHISQMARLGRLSSYSSSPLLRCSNRRPCCVAWPWLR